MLHLDVKPSISKICFLSLCYISALIAPSFSALAPSQVGLVTALVAASAGRFFAAIRVGSCWENGQIVLATDRACLHFGPQVFPAAAPTVRYLSEFLIVLRFAARDDKRRVNLFLCADSLSESEDKQLRRYLACMDKDQPGRN